MNTLSEKQIDPTISSGDNTDNKIWQYSPKSKKAFECLLLGFKTFILPQKISTYFEFLF